MIFLSKGDWVNICMLANVIIWVTIFICISYKIGKGLYRQDILTSLIVKGNQTSHKALDWERGHILHSSHEIYST